MYISKLQDVPTFAATIADRAWRAWWTDTDVSLDEYTSSIELMAESEGIPTALVVHVGLKYLGSVLLIDNDLDVRPQFSPWIAALWVEPESRSQGCAAKLINAAREEAANLGHDTCYLCATEANSPYYIARGFQLLEPNIQGLNIFSI
ncbi:MAG: GNAT family N-acetyltransferase [Alphaproteobacteria bacterium]